jgi:hypothetical protein
MAIVLKTVELNIQSWLGLNYSSVPIQFQRAGSFFKKMTVA